MIIGVVADDRGVEAGPTRGATDHTGASWARKRTLAVGLRLILALAPAALAWVITVALASHYYRPQGWIGVVAWLLQAAVVGTLVVVAAERLSRRALPLVTLFNLSLAFPDRAPSRF